MARGERNLPIDHKWHDTGHLGAMAKQHTFVDGEYVETPLEHQEYPKFKYHRDYVHDRKEGVEYSFTELPQLVNSEEEEEELGKAWKDTPEEAGVITSPDADTLQKQRKRTAAAGSNWRAKLSNGNPNVTDMHLRFVQSQGADQVKTMGDLYAFLAEMTSSQMKSFMAEAAEWEKAEEKKAKK